MTKGRLPRTLSRALGVGWEGKGLRLPQCPVLHTKPPPSLVCLSCASPRAVAGAPGSLVGGDGLGQPVQAVQVVVRGQVLLAGGTDGPGLQASPKHTCTGEVELRASPGLLSALGRAGTCSCTWHIGGMLQVVVGAAILGALHEV